HAANAHAVLLHRAQVRAAGKQGDVQSRARHARPDVGSDGAGADDQKLHCWPSRMADATCCRRIFPVAVRGMLCTMNTFFGHLYSARRSRQCLSSSDSWAPPAWCRTTAAATSSPSTGCGMPKVTASATAG